MMKSKLALIIGALSLVAGAANAAEIYNKDSNKLDLYGKVKGEHDFVSSNGNSDETYARLGFKGETQINSDITGFGQFEHQFNANQPEGAQTEKTRLAFAGLDFGQAGSIDYGRNYGVAYDIGSYADNLTEFGGDSYQYTDNYMNGRSTGLLTYRNNKLVDGLSVGLQYQGKNEDKRDWTKANGEGVGASVQYEIPDSGVTLGAAYTNAKTTDATDSFGDKVADGEHAEMWTTGVKYDANAVYLAATYAETRNMTPLTLKNYFGKGIAGEAFADKTENLEVMGAYTFDFGLRPSIGYVQSRQVIHGVGSDYATKYVQIGASYNFNKNFAVDAAYKINLVKDYLQDYGISTDDSVVLGATYQF
ncbi:porin [Salmonella enterica subsp. enterica serovar Enteritidis]|nr:porin [Salmonella enterica subsp. enterica serovar Enteritidis]